MPALHILNTGILSDYFSPSPGFQAQDSRTIAFGRFPTTEERDWGVLVGADPHQNTPNTLFTGLRMPLRAYAIALPQDSL